LALLIFQLLESGSDIFAEAIKKYEELSESNKQYSHLKKFADEDKLKKFLDAFKYICVY
jgi:hypothetical protein